MSINKYKNRSHCREQKLKWLAIPQISLLLVTMQVIGFVFVMLDPVWIGRLALIPRAVKAGEYWRLITFLSLPLSTNFFWMFFVLWFLYSAVNSIESEWGELKTTLYVLTSILVMIGLSFLLDYPVVHIADFQSILILAAATLFPNIEASLFFVFPIQLKWIAILTLFFTAVQIYFSSWTERIYLFAIFSVYFLFFSGVFFAYIKAFLRRWRFRRR